ncbi:helix-turn-helix transcriptional regulator [Meiothermus sp.]|uniref:helix-turn-helix domain-containing protein n=1 Tax=Meiothermus sp. TaxID=1955249 RepID=UPI00307F5C51
MKDKIELLMHENGDTPRTLARKANLAEGTIEHILTGRRGKRTSFYVIEKIAAAYGVSLDFFSSETLRTEPTA